MGQTLPAQVTTAVRRMSGVRRAMIAGVGALGIAAIFLVGSWASEPAWVTLYYDLPLSESGRMMEALQKAGIQSKLGADGSEVRVASDKVAAAKVLLAKDGMPQVGRKGFELFDDSQSWGKTEFDQKVMYQRALEGELSRTIGSVAGIQRAQVHLVLPSQSILRRDERAAEASVVLTVKPGMALASGAVQGIVYIVSNSVEGLTPEHVAVMDDAGRILSAPADQNNLAGLTNRQLEIQQSIEDHLAKKAERLLATLSGIGMARVTVSTDLNFDQVDRTVESYDPDRQVLANEQRSETEAGSDPAAGAQTIISNSYQNSRVLERISRGGGAIRRMTVAVLVDQRAMQADSTASAPIAARITEIEALVRNALGADSARGDRVSVTAIPFEPVVLPVTETAGPPPSPGILSIVERFLRPVIGLVAVLAMLFVAFRMTRMTTGTLAGAQGAAFAPASGDAVALGYTTEPPPLSPPSDTVLLKNRVQAEATSRPELAAQAVRAWMNEA